MDEIFHKQVELIDQIKNKIKDGEYKMLLENLSSLRDNTDKHLYVKVKVISITMTGFWSDIEGESDTFKRTSRASCACDFNHDSIRREDPDGFSEVHLERLSVNSVLETNEIIVKVHEHGDRGDNAEHVMTPLSYNRMKENHMINRGGEIWIYVEDM
ncbi:MAG: hypothetical protein CMJ25_11960 [Phycisphaerae bacterium]|nr:hypothetical protein [Phycisphaerae bacterium]|tara:strand:+ start:4512 stop:4982 length:471 start_codon:yes stop_codon:yes gene_type:complete